ncbi:MAG: SMODS domain-containing nucleotidyltransferase [Bacillota bacterium]
MPAEEQAFLDYLYGLELPVENVSDLKERSSRLKAELKSEIKISGAFWGGSYRRGTSLGSQDCISLHVVLSPKYFYECQKNSRKLLNYVRSRIDGDKFNINTAKGGQVLKVNFFSPPHLYLIPSIKLSSGKYLAPNGIGGWIKTNPLRLEELFNIKEELSGGKFKGLVKLLKSWNRHVGAPFNSYFLELLVYYRVNDFSKPYAELFNSVFWSMTVFLPEFLSCPAVREPVSLGELEGAGLRVEDAHNTAYKALSEKDSVKAVELWRSLLGNDFGVK